MADLKVTKIDLTEISFDSLDGVEASGGNWKKDKGYYYKIVNASGKCGLKGSYSEGPNKYSGKRVSDHCSSCGHLEKVQTYWVCGASKRKEI